MYKRKAQYTESSGKRKKAAIETRDAPEPVSTTAVSVRFILSKSLGNVLDIVPVPKEEGTDSKPGKLELIKSSTEVDQLTIDKAVEGAVDRVLTVSGQPRAIANAVKMVFELSDVQSDVEPETTTNEVVEDVKPPKRRGRPPKAKAPVEDSETATATVTTATTATTATKPRKPINIKLLVPHLLLILINRTNCTLPSEAESVQYALSKTFIGFSSDKTFSITTEDVARLHDSVLAITRVIQKVYDFTTPETVENVLSTSIPYKPQPLVGSQGHPDTFKRQSVNELLVGSNPYINPNFTARTEEEIDEDVTMRLPSGPASMRGANSGGSGDIDRARERERERERDYDQDRDLYYSDTARGAPTAPVEKVVFGASTTNADGTITQQLHIPNDVVGSVIGKSGQRITEIRQTSGCLVKIGDAPAIRTADRLVVIVGKPAANKVALDMIHKFIESDRWH